MTRLSNTDVLTGLYNRRYFDNEFERELKRSVRSNSMLSVIMLDIDDFKRINDTFGHQVGDEYLKKTAKTLTSVFKRESDIVACMGGKSLLYCSRALMPIMPANWLTISSIRSRP